MESAQSHSLISMTGGQHDIWYAQTLNPENPNFQIAQYLNINGQLDPDRLREAAHQVMSRTEAVNVEIVATANGPAQRLVPKDHRPEIVDLSGCGIESARERAMADMENDIGQPHGFDEAMLVMKIYVLGAADFILYQRVHHVLLDGYSAMVLVRQIADEYNSPGAAQKEVLTLTRLMSDEADYAASTALGQDRQYWEAELAELESVPSLSNKNRQPASRRLRAETTLSASTSKALAGGNSAATMVAIAGIYLHKMTGEKVVSLSFPVTARRGAFAKSIPAMLSNVVPVAIKVTPSKRIERLIEAASRKIRKALVHQRYRIPAEGGRSGYFGASVNVLPTANDLRFGDIPARVSVLSTGPVEDLSIVLQQENPESGAGTRIQFEADSGLYSQPELQEHLSRFQMLLEQALGDHNARVSALSVTTAQEAHSLLEAGAGVRNSLPESTLVDEFAAVVARRGSSTAITTAVGNLTFAELDQRSQALAQFLNTAGATTGTTVAVRMDRSPALAISLLAVLRSGAAVVPIDPEYPSGRVSNMLDVAAPVAFLTNSGLLAAANSEMLDVISREGVQLVKVDELNLTSTAGQHLGRPAPTDLAYIIFTSGSTGRPKGVSVDHRAIANLFYTHRDSIYQQAEANLGRKLRVAHTAGLSFDASWDPLLWLFDGHELHLVDDSTRRDPQALAHYFQAASIDSIETTPSFFRALLDQGLGEAPPSIIALGGEAVDQELWDELAAMENVTAYNFYGPSETTVDSMTAQIRSGSGVNLGQSVANSRHYVLDSSLRPVPNGAVGELYVAGENLAHGYFGAPSQSSESFIADPHGMPGDRMYRTGDLVTRTREGQVAFLGRVDQQVKIRGYRIEVAEVQSALRALEGVADAVVLLTLNGAGHQQLSAYLVGPESLESVDLRAALSRDLPDYMIPSTFNLLPALPLTANGKVDAAALPQPDTTVRGRAPETDAEKLVAAAFSEVLGVDEVGSDTSFFEIGGHSLLATKLATVLEREAGHRPELREIFESPRVSQLAQKLAAGHWDGTAITKGERLSHPPLSFGQQRLWFLNQYDTSSGAYNIPVVLDLKGSLDVAALKCAVRDIVARHESLRTSFPWAHAAPYQHVQPMAEAVIEIPVIEVSEETAESILQLQADRGFDVQHELPLRAVILKLSDQRHILALTIHHIAADGASLRPLGADLADAYRFRLAYGSDVQTGLPPLPLQYLDYTAWQQKRLGEESDPQSTLAKQMAYWKQELSDLPDQLNLPYDRRRNSQEFTVHQAQEPQSHSIAFALPASTVRGMKRMAAEHDASMFMLMQTILASLLSKLGAGEDIPLGAPTAGRGRPELEELVGFFVNTLVLRTRVSSRATPADLLDQVRTSDLSSYANQDAPFERLVEVINPPRVANRQPLFQVMLAIQDAVVSELPLGAVTAHARQEAQTGGAKFDLLMNVNQETEDDSSLLCSLEFAPELFDKSTVENLAKWFTALAKAFVTQRDTPLGELLILDPQEQQEVLRASSTPASRSCTSRVLPETVIGAWEQTAQTTPQATSVSDDHESVNFSTAAGRVSEIARGLLETGVKKGDRAVIALPRRVDMPLALLAGMMAGAVVVPLDTTYPKGRIEQILQDCKPSVVVCDQSFAQQYQRQIDGTLAPTVDVDTLRSMGRTMSTKLPTPTAEDGAYLIYTSGSTGRPKGVLVAHKSLANLFAHHWGSTYAAEFSRAAEHGMETAVAHVSGLGFDAAWDPILWLIAGAHLHMVPDSVRTNPQELVDYVQEHRISVLESTPSLVAQLLQFGLTGANPFGILLALGGEQIPLDLWEDLCAAEVLRAYNFYGPTEFTVDSVIAQVTGEQVNIGFPVTNVKAYVLDDSLNLLPAGAVGELYLSGAGSALGYWSRPGETSQAFVPDPFIPGARMYRTGDIVRRGPVGALEFVDRADQQVKLRGYRIELGEIEGVLRRQRLVKDAAAVVDEQSGQIFAYVVPAADAPNQLSEQELLDGCKDFLPLYMLPSRVLALDAIPLTSHGKLDRAALPTPSDTSHADGREPSNDVERAVCEAFGQALGRQSIAVDDDFFALGGHSLLAVKVIAGVQEHLAVTLPLRALFDAPTPEKLARRIGAIPVTAAPESSQNTSPGFSTWLEARLGSGPAALPLSWAQRRMWFLNQLDPGASDYNIVLGVRLTGQLDAQALIAAVRDLQLRHEVLRTTYPVPAGNDGEPIQAVLPAEELPTHVVQCTSATSERDAEHFLHELAQRGFDVKNELPMRAQLIDLGSPAVPEWILQLVIHHIASDGASLAPLAADLEAAYRARTEGSEQQAPLAAQYGDYALWQREDSQASLEGRAQQWAQLLQGAPEQATLPVDRARPATARQSAGVHQFTVPPEATEQLRALAARSSASLFVVVHAALNSFLARVSGDECVVIGSPAAGRANPLLAPMVGFFVNTLPIAMRHPAHESLAESATVARNAVLAAFDFQDVPFEKLVEAVAPERQLGRHPLFQVMLTLENEQLPALQLPQVTARPLQAPSSGEAKFDLSFTFVAAAARGMEVNLEYNSDMFAAEHLKELMEQFVTFLTGAAAHPDTPLEDIELLTPQQYSSLQAVTAGEAQQHVPDTVLHTLAETTQRTPDAVAIISAGSTGRAEELTFAELDSAVGSVAVELVKAGVKHQDVVSVYLNRSASSLIAALGIMRAGAVYNPIDIEYPAARVAGIINDAQPALVLVDSAGSKLLKSAVSEADAAGVPVLDIDEARRANGTLAAVGMHLARETDAAYLLFTSGSTGRPKGVLVDHRSLASLLASHQSQLIPEVDKGQIRVAHTSGVGFDASIDPLLWLLCGHQVHMLHDPLRRDPEALAKYFAAENIGAWETTPSFAGAMLSQRPFLERGRQPGQPFSLALGGEAFDSELWRALNELPGFTAWNLYGPTESTVDAIIARTQTSSEPQLGRVNPNTRAYVLDDRLTPVPARARGELYLAGAQLARGYYGRPDLSAERFVADPFAPGERMYRTGDVVERSADGTLIFQGRNDQQVKIRGYRVELGEVRRVLREVEPVQDAAVLVREDPGSGLQRLLAWLVTDQSTVNDGEAAATLSAAALSHARGLLPGYMVPSAAAVISELPLSANGKLDASALADPQAAATRSAIPPSTPVESELCKIYCNVLGLDQVGVDESFFDLGGHSLLAQQLILRVNEVLGTELAVQSIFRSPTVQDLIAEGQSGREDSVQDSLRRVLVLRSAGEQTPLFVVHPATGLSWPYSALLSRLPDRPIYGLQMPGLVPEEGTGIAAASLRDLAADYVNHMQTVQAHGPYNLLGWSFGGNLAQAMATELQTRGEEVQVLAILDAFPSNLEGIDEAGLGNQGLVNFLSVVGYEVTEEERPSLDASRVLEVLTEQHNPLGAVSPETVDAMVRNFGIMAELIKDGEPVRFLGDMVVFSVTEDLPENGGTVADWRPFVSGKLSNHLVHTIHAKMMTDEALDEIAPWLLIHLDGASE